MVVAHSTSHFNAQGKENSHFCRNGIIRPPWVSRVNSSDFNGTVTAAVTATFGSVRGSCCYLRAMTHLVLWLAVLRR